MAEVIDDVVVEKAGDEALVVDVEVSTRVSDESPSGRDSTREMEEETDEVEEETDEEEMEDVWGEEGSSTEFGTLTARASVSLGRSKGNDDDDDVCDGSAELGKASSWGHGNSNVGIVSPDCSEVVAVSEPVDMS